MTTDKYNLGDLSVATSGWDAIFDANMEKIDDAIATRDIRVAGETLAAYEAVYIKSDGKFWLAQADGTAMPAFGIMIEAAAVTEEKRAQVSGSIINVAWAWASIGEYVYLDTTTPGALTQTIPTDNAQVIGIAMSATEIFIQTVVAADRPYNFGGTFNGTPSASLALLRIPIPEGGATIPASLDGSKMIADVAATAETVFAIKKNGSSIGTATFAISGTTATFAGAGASFAEDDVLTMISPASPDATLADFGWMIVGSRPGV